MDKVMTVSEMARLGGLTKSSARAAASRVNGSKGGRPAALTAGLGLVPTGKYVNPTTGSVDTGSSWECDYQADQKLPKDVRCKSWTLVRVRRTKTVAEKDEHGEWMPYK